MTKPTQAQRTEQLESRVEALEKLVNKLIGERRDALEARDRGVRRQIGLPS
jgi:cell division protein FtsB